MRHGGWRAGSAVGLALVTIGLAGGSPARADATTTTLKASPSATVASQKARVSVTGEVTPDGRRPVHLQKRVGRTWVTVASTTSATTGSYSLRLPTSEAGTQVYRTYAPATSGRAVAGSTSFTVAVGPGSASSHAFLTSPPVRWDPCTTIGYRVNIKSAPAGAAKDIHEAVRQVSLATGLKFSYLGQTSVVPGRTSTSEPDAYPKGTQLVIAYTPAKNSQYLSTSDGALGVGGVFYQLKAERVNRKMWHRAVQGYVVLDPAHNLPAGFGAGRSTGKLGTWGQVVMHEMGHVVGLDHPGVADPTQIMHPATTKKPARWGAGDLAGLRVLGKSSGCFAATKSAAGNTSAAMTATIRS